MSLPVVVYISPNTEPCPVFHELAEKISFQAQRLKDIRELFVALSDHNTVINLIIFDLPGLYSINGASIFEIINMISTLTRSSISACTPILSVLIEEKSCPKMIKGVLGTDIKGFVPKGDWLGPAPTTREIMSTPPRANHCAMWLT